MNVFKRLGATVSRSANRVMPDALTAARETLKLAQAAQLPICAPAISLALEILNIIQTVKEATTASIELLQTMHVYDETIANMVEIMSPNYLETSGDAQARIARKSIKDFESTMASIKATLDKNINQKTWKKALNNSHIKAEMETCSRRLAAAREQFNSSTMMIILANTCTAPSQGAEIDDFRIPGATPLGSQDIKLGPLMLKQNSTSLPTFWADVRVATVRGRKKLVKLYPSKDGGEEAFLQDMNILTKNLWPNLPAVLGYSRHSSVPFIVFENSCVERFGRYLKTLVSTEPGTAITKVWRMLVNLRDAADFLIKNEPEMDGRVIRAAFMNPFVDENGEIILAPQSEFTRRNKLTKQRTENLNANRLVLTYWAGNCLDGRFRPLRNLGLALMGEAEAALGLDYETPTSPESLNQLLHRHWPQVENRSLTWFLESQSPCSPGDLGVFILQDDSVSFRRLGSVADALGGLNIQFQDGLYVERMADDIVRFAFDPLGDDPGPVHNCVIDGGMYILWKNSLSHHSNTWNYLEQNASKLAHQYGTVPEELVLITETTGHLESDPFGDIVSQLACPIYYYAHFSEAGHPTDSYWSFMSTPGSRISDAELGELCLPEVEISAYSRPVRYLQLEKEDLTHRHD